MRYFRTLTVLTGLLAAAPLRGQEPAPPLQPGARVRLSVPIRTPTSYVQGSGRWIAGELLALDSAQIALRPDRASHGAEYIVPLDVVHRLEVSRAPIGTGEGIRRGVMRGAVVGGLLAEGLLGFGFVLAGYMENDEPCPDMCQLLGASPDRMVRNGLIGVAAGALLGTAFGSASRERWEPVPVPGLAVSLSASAVSFTVPAGH